MILGCLLVLGASGLYSRIISKKLKTSTELTRRLPWFYLGLSYILFYLIPPALFGILSMSNPLMWVLTAISALSLLGMSLNFLFYDPKK